MCLKIPRGSPRAGSSPALGTNYFNELPILPLSARIRFSLTVFATEFLSLKLLYAIPGGTLGAILGVIFRRLKENRLGLEALHQDFELQTSTLRHHYKNLTIGIEGFSKRIKRNVTKLDEVVRQCASDECLTQVCYRVDFESLANNLSILEATAQRLNQKLGQEVRLLKALTSDSVKAQPREFYTFLKQNVAGAYGSAISGEKAAGGDQRPAPGRMQ